MARESKKNGGIRWRMWLALGGLGVVCVSSGMAALRVHRYVMTDPQFTLSPTRKDALTIQGLNNLAPAKILRVFAGDFGHSVFSVPLAARRRRLLAVDWVQDASVSRIWPDRLLVRIRERKPVAFAALRSGSLLVDADGVLLEPPASKGSSAHFNFPVLSGFRDEEPEGQRRERVGAFLRFQQEMGYLANDVSEIDVSDPNSIRIVARVDNRAIELLMGGDDFAARYKNFLTHYPEIEKMSPEVRSYDLRLDDRITAKK